MKAGRHWASITALVLGIALAILILVNAAIESSLDSVYGNPEETQGPGRNEDQALSFDRSSAYPNGLSISASSPSSIPVPENLLTNGYTIGWTTTISFTNTGDQPVQIEPIGRGVVVNGNDCKSFGPTGLSAIDTVAESIPAKSTATILADFACSRTGDNPLPTATPSKIGQTEVQLAIGPKPYDPQTFFRGTLRRQLR